MSTVVENLTLLRKSMKENGASWYFITSDDYHASEYVADYFKVREHYTGFTGENAFLLLNDENAYMWTDGRFFIQAEKELSDTGVTLMKMGEPGVPSVTEFIKENVKQKDHLFFDGRMVSTSWGKRIEAVLNENGATMSYGQDLAGLLWENRPAMPSNSLSILKSDVVGEETKSKLARIRTAISDSKASCHFLGSLDDIAWITNLRGKDVECNPVFLSYMFITQNDAVLFLQSSEASNDVVSYLSDCGIRVADYDDVLFFLNDYSYSGSVLLDEGSVNYSCFKTISNKTEIVNKMNPSKAMKAVKNDIEIERLKEAYLLDSVCVTKFIYWLKNAVNIETVTEISAADYIDNLRRQVPGFLDLSFPTISGYGSNGAIVHYGVTEESNAVVKPEGFLLVDSGGQYEKGTTDVTRTVSVGPVNDKMRLHYTKTALGMIQLANAKFLYGCSGRNLDILCRQPLWNLGIDYKHGTGHGVGYILNVHEGPQNIRWKFIEGMTEYPLEPGMITSDEPGVYIEGEYGIRIENIILCVDDFTNSDGRFLKFEHLTYAPLDRNALDKSVVNSYELELINQYQELVYEKVKDYLSDEEKAWLRAETLPL